MGKKRFGGSAVDIKALLAEAPKVRPNAWAKGAVSAVLAPKPGNDLAPSPTELPLPPPQQGVQAGHSQCQMQPPPRLHPTYAPVHINKAAAMVEVTRFPNEGHLDVQSTEIERTNSEPSDVQFAASFDEDGSYGGQDVCLVSTGDGIQPIGVRQRRHRPRSKKQAVIAHTANFEFELPSGWASEANPMGDQVQSTRGGGQPKIMPEIWQAVKDGDEDAVYRLICAGVCLNARSKNGDTLLIKAAEYGRVRIMQFLLDAGADINKRGWSLQTALMRAVISEHCNVVNLLIESKANSNMQDSDGKRPLVMAIERNNAVLVEMLLTETDDLVDIMLHAVWTVLEFGHGQELLTFLLRQGCSVDCLSCPDTWGSDRSAFLRAVRMDRQDLAYFLAGAGMPVNVPNRGGESPLIFAVKHGSPNMVRTLLECGCAAEGVAIRTSPLIHAVRADRPEIVEILLDAGAPIGDAAQEAKGDCRQLLESAAERRTLVLTLHVGPAVSEGMLDVICTDMGGSEMASVCAELGEPLENLRQAIFASLEDCEVPPQLLLPDGRLLVAADDQRPLAEVLGAMAEPQAHMEPMEV